MADQTRPREFDSNTEAPRERGSSDPMQPARPSTPDLIYEDCWGNYQPEPQPPRRALPPDAAVMTARQLRALMTERGSDEAELLRRAFGETPVPADVQARYLRGLVSLDAAPGSAPSVAPVKPVTFLDLVEALAAADDDRVIDEMAISTDHTNLQDHTNNPTPPQTPPYPTCASTQDRLLLLERAVQRHEEHSAWAREQIAALHAARRRNSVAIRSHERYLDIEGRAAIASVNVLMQERQSRMSGDPGVEALIAEAMEDGVMEDGVERPGFNPVRTGFEASGERERPGGSGQLGGGAGAGEGDEAEVWRPRQWGNYWGDTW